MKNYTIAIDGPAGAGKSTISQLISKKLNIEYIDTGAMYRALTLKVMRENIDIDNENQLYDFLNNTKIDFKENHIYLDGIIVDEDIRDVEVTKRVSEVSKKIIVRERLLNLQREIAKDKSVIMDGRDIGTSVLENSKYKFYLNASIEERSLRRYNEVKHKKDITLEEVKNDIIRRDNEDMSRKNSPLKKAEDAYEIDSTSMNIEEVVNCIVGIVKKQENGEEGLYENRNS